MSDAFAAGVLNSSTVSAVYSLYLIFFKSVRYGTYHMGSEGRKYLRRFPPKKILILFQVLLTSGLFGLVLLVFTFVILKSQQSECL